MQVYRNKIVSSLLTLLLVLGLLAPSYKVSAAISVGTVGTTAAGSTSLSVTWPPGISAGNLLVLAVINKYPTNAPTTPSGWQLVDRSQWFGGIGSAGADSGNVYTTVFVRVADGSETSGGVTVSIGSGNCALGVITYYTKAGNRVWDVAAASSTHNTAGSTAWSATAGINPGITSGDMVIAVSGVNTDAYTFASQSMSASSATLGSHTEQVDVAASNGDDCKIVLSTHAVTAGTASAAPVYTMTSSGSSATAPTGATIFLRIREVATSTAQTTITSPVSVTGGISVLGALAKGAGTFVIDHPLDPKNKLLYHSFVESPEVKNIYDGIVMLNAKGEATITLPPYFLALGRDYRYLATPIGEPMPNLHLTQEVRKNFFGLFGEPVFTLGGGEPHGRVSWQVSAVRKDPFILANPIVPEVPKGPEEIADVGEYVCIECYE